MWRTMVRQSDQPDQAAAAAPAAVDEDDISQVVANSRRSTFSVFFVTFSCACARSLIYGSVCACVWCIIILTIIVLVISPDL